MSILYVTVGRGHPVLQNIAEKLFDEERFSAKKNPEILTGG